MHFRLVMSYFGSSVMNKNAWQKKMNQDGSRSYKLS
jgi:hypothetical protein